LPAGLFWGLTGCSSHVAGWMVRSQQPLQQPSVCVPNRQQELPVNSPTCGLNIPALGGSNVKGIPSSSRVHYVHTRPAVSITFTPGQQQPGVGNIVAMCCVCMIRQQLSSATTPVVYILCASIVQQQVHVRLCFGVYQSSCPHSNLKASHLVPVCVVVNSACSCSCGKRLGTACSSRL
jgi:hypothetical protein